MWLTSKLTELNVFCTHREKYELTLCLAGDIYLKADGG